MTRPRHLHLDGRHIAAAAALVLFAIASPAATYDCGRATGRVERLVCATPELSTLDDELGEVHAEQPREGEDGARARDAQRAWLRARDGCADVACVRASYELRIEELACDPARASAGSAMGASTCAQARLRRLDRTLDAREGPAMERWRRTRRERCAAEGRAEGGAPGWQHAAALACEVAATQQRLSPAAGSSRP